MKTQTLSNTRLRRLRAQGFETQSDAELTNLSFGIRFAYRLCITIMIVGLLMQSIEMFAFLMLVAFSSILMPNHLFDYFYNHLMSRRMNLPKLPPRSKQLKFACTIATSWLATIIYFMNAGDMMVASILTGMFIIIALLPSTIDLCVPSIIYNAIFRKNRVKNSITI